MGCHEGSRGALTVRILLVEDDTAVAANLREQLAGIGYAVDWSRDGMDAEFQGRETDYDAIVLDLGLPGRPGLQVLTNWRAAGVATPVLILTARDAWHERVDGLKAGADDYLGKPFRFEELAARLQALIRRAAGRAAPSLRLGGLTLDEDRQRALLADGRTVELTGTEFRLLRYLMSNPGKVLSKARLTDHVYDQGFDRDSNLIEVYVRRLREKLGAERIQTQRGQGYVFRDEP
jgi:DNA-binding response OmpR family regulator